MKRHIFPTLLLMLLAMFFARTASAGVYDIFYTAPYTVEPDSTKVIYPIPVNSGDPFQNLNNQSPLYLNDPDNFSTEIIYDPVTGQYTFKRRIGEFYYDTPSTLTHSSASAERFDSVRVIFPSFSEADALIPGIFHSPTPTSPAEKLKCLVAAM